MNQASPEQLKKRLAAAELSAERWNRSITPRSSRSAIRGAQAANDLVTCLRADLAESLAR